MNFIETFHKISTLSQVSQGIFNGKPDYERRYASDPHPNCRMGIEKRSGLAFLALQVKIQVEVSFWLNLIDKCDSQNRGLFAGRKSNMFNLGTKDEPFKIMGYNFLDIFVDMESVMAKALQEPSHGNLFCIISPGFAGIIPIKELFRGKGRVSPGGKFGKLSNIDLYVSNFLPSIVTPLGTAQYAFFGTSNAMALKLEVFKKFFKVKHKVIRPDWLGQLCFVDGFKSRG